MGLEIDAPTVKRNLRRSMTISLGALLIPFGLGSVISVLLYRHFIEPEGTGVSFRESYHGQLGAYVTNS
jgi:Kef-type K+ transport system membrane component KefB